MDNLISHPGLIAGFIIAVMAMLAIDLGIFSKKTHVVSNKEAITWSVVWISMSMIFSAFIFMYMGVEKFSQYQSAYWIEKALSVDNLFVFILVFGFFNVPKALHHKVLYWGIIGAIIMRAIFIFVGVGMINLTYLGNWFPGVAFFQTYNINIILTLFGLFLIYAGIKSALVEEDDDEQDFSKSPGARIVHKFFNVSKNWDDGKFFTIENGKKLATPLLIVVAVIEFTDLLFAVDSIPAVIAIAPNDPFILYTSNIFAILGLRALYFLLANFIHLFSKLKYGLAFILSFIGAKMLFAPVYHISSTTSLFIVLGALILSVVASLIFPDPIEERNIQEA